VSTSQECHSSERSEESHDLNGVRSFTSFRVTTSRSFSTAWEVLKWNHRILYLGIFQSEIKEGVEVCRNSRYKISMEEYLAERSMLFNAWSEFSCLDSMGIAYQFDGNKLLPIRLDKGPL
jgi:hypothetical protein